MGRRIPRERLLETAIRREIFDRVQATPGIHLRQLQRDMGVSLGSLEYHLYRLVGGGLLVTRGDNHLKAYFCRDGFDRRDCDVLHSLRQRMQRRIAVEVLTRPGIAFHELVERLPIGASSTSFHLRRMVHGHILEEQPQGRTKTYTVVEPERVQRLILRYRSTFTDDVVDRFAEAWLDIVP